MPTSSQSREPPALRDLAPNLASTLGEYLVDYRETYAKSVRCGQSALEAARGLSRAYDGLLGALYCAADAASPGRDGRIALVAVGGYGRGLVGLHSDVDVLLLCDDPASARPGAVAQGLLYPLWDLGVDIGYAVRGADETIELARSDVRTATTLIDLRPVAGDRSLVNELSSRSRRQVFGPHLGPFIRALQEDTATRHKRFGDSLHLLEPDVKSGRGGLRDYDVGIWALSARWNAGGLDDALRSGVVASREAQQLKSAHEFLWMVRSHLHLRAKRRQDRLTFGDQEEIAYALGFTDGLTLAVEQFMQAYYRHAGVVAASSERLLERALPSERRRSRRTLRSIGDGIAEFDGQITFERTDRLHDEPILALRLFEQVLSRRQPPYAFARESIARYCADADWCARLRDDPNAGPLFVRLMVATERSGVPKGSLPAELHTLGLTTALIPELEPLVGRVIHDVYHVYTFDIHAIRALDRLRALARGKRFEYLGLASRLAAELPRKAPVLFAAFLHSLGRVHGHGGRDQAAEMCEPIAARLGFSSSDQAHLQWLLQTRHAFYQWATQRDTSDPNVLQELADQVGSTERLRDLYLLTVAILSTTNPTAMTSWKARLLDDLYLGLAMVIEGESVADRANDLRQEVMVGFVGDEGEQGLIHFVARLPDRYVLANDADAVRRHARLVRDGGRFALGLGPGPSDGVSELVLWTEDRPGLLAELCAVLASHHVGVVGAQLYTVGDMAFDVLWARRARESHSPMEGQASRLDRKQRARIEQDLRSVLEGNVSVDVVLARVPPPPAWSIRRSPRVPTVVNVDNSVSPRHTVVDVFARDRVGVLHVIARTLHEQGVTIRLAKVNTEGDRVADVFYVCTPDGTKLDAHQASGLQNALVEALQLLGDDDTPSQPPDPRS